MSAKADFFAPPPPELGQILTASTTLNRKEKPLTLTGRWSRAIIAAVGACLIGIMIVLLAEVQLIGWKLTWIAGLPLVGSLIAWLATIFEHSVTYVGTEGVAKIKCRHQRNRISSIEIFRFSTASQLRTGQTRHYRNFAYTNTTYEFTWSNDEGEKIFSISGSYANEKGNPEDDTDSFWFAHSAETVWSWYLLERTLAELDSKGYIHFALSGDDFVRLGPRVIHLHVSGKDARIKAEEMGGISLGGGQFTVKHKDAKPGFLGFGRSGIFKFDYSSMANGRFFLLALEKLMGYKF